MVNSGSMVKVYLDDIRNPKEDDWIVVRNYDDFKKVILELPSLPDVISFDHDLDLAHYTQEVNERKRIWIAVNDSKHSLEYLIPEKSAYYYNGDIEKQHKTLIDLKWKPTSEFDDSAAERNGLHAAQWFTNHVIDNNLEDKLKNMTFFVHSANPAGAENIVAQIKGLQKAFGLPQKCERKWI